MKKGIYYASLALLWIVVITLLAILCLLVGLMPIKFGFGYSLGGACGHPQLWIVSLGVVLLLRPFVFRLVMGEKKNFKRTLPIILVVVGLIWLAMNVGARMYYEKAKQEMESIG